MAKSHLVVEETIVNKIYFIRSQKVMLDNDLAALCGVETKVFNPGRKKKYQPVSKRFYAPVTGTGGSKPEVTNP